MKAVARTLYGSVLGDSSSSLLWRPASNSSRLLVIADCRSFKGLRAASGGWIGKKLTKSAGGDGAPQASDAAAAAAAAYLRGAARVRLGP